jgi:hypothetical protein
LWWWRYFHLEVIYVLRCLKDLEVKPRRDGDCITAVWLPNRTAFSRSKKKPRWSVSNRCRKGSYPAWVHAATTRGVANTKSIRECPSMWVKNFWRPIFTCIKGGPHVAPRSPSLPVSKSSWMKSPVSRISWCWVKNPSSNVFKSSLNCVGGVLDVGYPRSIIMEYCWVPAEYFFVTRWSVTSWTDAPSHTWYAVITSNCWFFCSTEVSRLVCMLIHNSSCYWPWWVWSCQNGVLHSDDTYG